ncbi:D-alanyl-D-alanine carboxypeptidase/D-alanyl-D-alanine endopeptidase [Carboxylicivirga taeanensis]|uniref:D-alanyl-D-alanine carboxypeptidase/D-alanyl-D-alanine endopeptidase n=1 Tax=Carboxylicivirga taeanensis TaxID=1416875 RepID=UPI003F6E1F5E
MRYLLILSVLTLCACTGISQQNKPKGEESIPTISKQGAVSVLAVEVTSGEVVAAYHPDMRMTPASLTKILSTAAALEVLGPEFKFETNFYVQKQGGHYNLHVVGGADPTIGSRRFEESRTEVVFKNVLTTLKARGISSIESLAVDNSCLNGIPYPSKRLWEDMGNYYGAVPNGLTYKENTFALTMRSPNGVGRPVDIVRTDPVIDVGIDCEVRTAANNKDSAYIYGNRYMKEWYVSGSIPQGRSEFVIKGALPHPELTLARELKAFLIRNGIAVNAIERKHLEESTETALLLCHSSPPLREIIKVINKTSHNLFADHLLLALVNEPNEVSWDEGVRALSNYWANNLSGFSASLYDGSGLSPFNAFCATDMVSVLRQMHQSDLRSDFLHSLSLAGTDGTLKRILKEPEFKGKVQGKSGSMNGVLGYCGYLTTNGGKTLAFCIMANHFTEPYSEIRSNMEALMKQIIVQN